jgi:ankyrin repeat protein
MLASQLHCCNAPLVTLLAAGADACVQTPEGKSALHIAAVCGHKEKCRLLINASRHTLTMRYGKGRCAIADAVVKGHLEVVELIHAECPAAVHSTDNNGNTLLHCAVQDERGAAVLPYLLSCSLNVNATDHTICREGRYNAVFTAVKCEHTDVVEVMLNSGVRVTEMMVWQTVPTLSNAVLTALTSTLPTPNATLSSNTQRIMAATCSGTL